jgi:hypothetical protein
VNKIIKNLPNQGIQIGLILGIVSTLLSIIHYYVVDISIISLIVDLLFIISLPILFYWIFTKTAFQRSFKNLLIFYSKVFQIWILLSFSFSLYLHSYIDPNLGNQLIEKKIAKSREKTEEYEKENHLIITNKAENEADEYNRYKDLYTPKTLINNYLISILTMLFLSCIISFFQSERE